MPGFYHDGEYDVAGFIVGSVARDQLIDGKGIARGDMLIGLPSSGLHTTGYSLARRIAFEAAGLEAGSPVPWDPDLTIGQALLVPHRSYLRPIRPLLPAGAIKGMAHITGGGITENLPRVFPPGVHAAIDRASWTVPPIFGWLQDAGEVPEPDMLCTFNMGIGLIVVVGPEDAPMVLRDLQASGEPGARIIGEIVSGGEGVTYQ
jgi:phosphoribosylformylglycinamidine cyclo-ligase